MNEQNEVCFNFGRSRGTRAKDDIGLLNWMLDPTRLFAPDTKEIAQRIIAEQTGHLF